MLKNISRLEHVIGNRIYHFICDSDSPLSEVKETLGQFINYVNQIEEAFKASQENKDAIPVEDIKVEE